MRDEEPESKPALQSYFPPVSRPGNPPASQGFDWRAFWNGVKYLIRNGKKVGGRLEAAQTPADDVLLGKVGLVTARIAIGKTGEIRLPIRGGTQDYMACARAGSNDTMEVDSTAEVVAFSPPNTVFVKPRM